MHIFFLCCIYMFTHIRDLHSSAQVPMETFRSQLFLAVLNKGAVEAMDSGQEITKLWFVLKNGLDGPQKTEKQKNGSDFDHKIAESLRKFRGFQGCFIGCVGRRSSQELCVMSHPVFRFVWGFAAN